MAAINHSRKSWANGTAPPMNGTNMLLIDTDLKEACDRIDELGLDSTVDAKTTAVGADELLIRDSAAAGKVKKLTFTNMLSYLGTLIAALTGKTTPVDGDSLQISDSEASPTGLSKSLTMANLWVWIKSKISGISAKTTPVDADAILMTDSEDATSPKRMTWANIKAGIWSAWGALINVGTGKTTPVDADAVSLMDSAASNATKKLTLANLFTYIGSKLYSWVAALTEKATPVDADNFHYADSVGAASKRVTWANIKATLKAYFDTLYSNLSHQARHRIGGADALPAAAEGTPGLVGLSSTTPSALGSASKGSGTAAAKSDHVHAMPGLDDIGEGTTYKRVTAAEKTALTAGYSHLAKLAAAEAETAMFDYDTAAKMPPALLREIVEASSGGAATVLVDDLGYPSMMYIVRGPILAGHIHADMGSVSALKTAVIAAAGTGYTANDVLTIAGGTGGTVRVLTVGASGEVTSIVIANPGTGYSAATGAATTGGTGSACTITTTIAPVHPAFRVNGSDKNALYIGMFKSYQYGSGATARAVSWPGLMPTASLDFDASKALHTNKGAGFHMMTIWEQGLLMWLSMKMSTEPRGNTYYGRSHESGYEYECGIRSDGLNPGTASGTGKHRNGSGPSKWAHNWERWGIHDLVGSLWEWRDGMKIVDGRIFLPNDNYYALAEGSWPAQDVYLDDTTAKPGGAPRLSNARDNALADPNYSSVAHKDMTLTAGFDGLDLAIRQRMLLAGLAPKIASAGSNPWNPKGTIYHRNYGERLPLCGGHWNNVSNAGLAALYLTNPRSYVGSDIGSRLAFLSP